MLRLLGDKDESSPTENHPENFRRYSRTIRKYAVGATAVGVLTSFGSLIGSVIEDSRYRANNPVLFDPAIEQCEAFQGYNFLDIMRQQQRVIEEDGPEVFEGRTVIRTCTRLEEYVDNAYRAVDKNFPVTTFGAGIFFTGFILLYINRVCSREISKLEEHLKALEQPE